MHEENIVPEEVADEIRTKNIREQIPIALALKQGYDISMDNWKKLADASDNNTVLRILREDVKLKEPRDSALLIFRDRDGTITATKAGVTEFVGFMPMDERHNKVAEAARDRIMKAAGILVK